MRRRQSPRTRTRQNRQRRLDAQGAGQRAVGHFDDRGRKMQSSMAPRRHEGGTHESPVATPVHDPGPGLYRVACRRAACCARGCGCSDCSAGSNCSTGVSAAQRQRHRADAATPPAGCFGARARGDARGLPAPARSRAPVQHSPGRPGRRCDTAGARAAPAPSRTARRQSGLKGWAAETLLRGIRSGQRRLLPGLGAGQAVQKDDLVDFGFAQTGGGEQGLLFGSGLPPPAKQRTASIRERRSMTGGASAFAGKQLPTDRHRSARARQRRSAPRA